MLKFRVNEYITLKLEDDKTVIYLKDIKFMKCKRLFINIPKQEMEYYEDFDSIDEIAEGYKKYLIDIQTYHRNGQIDHLQYEIEPEEEFWGHCSNLQAWAENNYDTRLLHYTLAFPLLKKLTEYGDSQAKQVFKEEIAKRLGSGHQPTIQFLFNERFAWNYLTNEELLSIILDPNDYNALIEAFPDKYKEFSFIIERLDDKNRDGINISIVKKRIVELYLRDLNLKTFPKSLTKLTALEKLWISDNNIKTLPNAIKNLKSLKLLDVSDNQLIDLPDSINELTSLEEIWITGNKIKDIKEKIEKIKSIKKII